MWPELIDALQAKAGLVTDAEERGRLLARVAGLLERVGRDADARDAWEQVVGLRPDDGAAFRALAALCEQAGDQEALAHTLERELDGLAAREDAEVRRSQSTAGSGPPRSTSSAA